MLRLFILSATLFLVMSCADTQQAPVSSAPSLEELKLQKKADHKLFHATLRKHIKAIGDKDIVTLKTMMSPDGLMHLIRPKTEVLYSTDNYIKYHELWFQEGDWSIKSTITDSEVGSDLGFAVTDLRYKEPERNGKPYWNQMVVTYVLKKIDGAWYVISDHSGSIKTSAG